MMLVTRLVLVIAALVLLAHGQDAKTPVAVQQEVISLNTTTNDRHRVDKDENSGDHRQGRMALHAELPSSKVKREQVLRNILAARRRQLLGPRVSEMPKNLSPWPRTPRPALTVSKDPLDMLEAQETRHGVYVTAPIGDEVAIVMENDEEDSMELVSEDFGKAVSSTLSSLEILAKPEEQVDRSTKNSLLIKINETNDKSQKNVSQPLARSQKNPDPETRRKNTVAMPESLYNHFRPVESNIPVEDMTQFLYFGQKIHPESHNSSTGTNNSILDTTSTSASVPISRRRYSMKRFSTTTAIPVPRLEEMINEEMNIALERSTIEKNKIPKTKNIFRSPGSGTYFRKSAIKPSDQTIVSNVIPTRESARNASAESESARPNPSAHAYQFNQVAIVSDRGSSNARSASVADNALAHRARNTTTGNAASFPSEIEIAKTEEISETTRGLAIDNKQLNSTNDKIINGQSAITKTIDDSDSEASINTESSTMQLASTTNYELNDEKSNKITTWQFVHSNGEESTTFSTKIDADNDSKMTMRTINNLPVTPDPRVPSTNPTDATTASLAHSSLRIVVTEPMGYESGTSASWESAEAAEEDGKDSDEDAEEEEEAKGKVHRGEESPVNQADSRKDRSRPTVGESVRSSDRHRVSGLPSNLPTSISSSGVNSSSWRSNASDSPPRSLGSPSASTAVESPLVASVSSEPEHLPPMVSVSSTEKTTNKQQHAYAYEITNVTRLLRNYTGPGLNVVMDRQAKEDKRKKESEDEAEEEEKRKNTSKKKQRKLGDEREEEKEERGKEDERSPALTRTNAGGSIQKIRNDGGSGQPTPQQSPLPLLLLPTLQRPSSSSGGIVESAARTPGVLSAGTDVDEATASTTSTWNTITSTGSTPIIRSAGSSGNSGARGSRSGDSSSSQSPSASSSSYSSSSASSSSSSSSTSLLVGERGRKGALGARQQYHQQNQNRGIAAGGRASALSAGSSGSSIGARNTWPSASTPVTSTEVSRASTAGVEDYVGTTSFNNGDRKRIDEVTENILFTSTLRWNHTGIKKLTGGIDRPEGYVNDRRYLRKSVSAVLNQRTIDESLVKELKRRRESTLQSGGSVDSSSPFSSSFNNRRIKGFRSGINEESRSSVSRSMENSTAVTDTGDSQSTTSQSTRGHEDALSEESDKISKVSDKMTEEQGKVTVGPSANINQTITPRSVIMEKVPEVTVVTTVAPASIPQASAKKLPEETKSEATEKELTSAKVAKEGQVKSDERSNFTEQVTPGALSGVSDSVIKSERTKDEPSDSVSTPIIPSDTLSSVGNTEPLEITTTNAPPAFPVTPRMLKEPDEVPKNVESSDVADSDDQTKRGVNTPEASRPFGLAKDLDPSEIQKMYRSQTTLKPESVMTTIIPGFMETSTDLNPENPVTLFTGKDQPGTISPVNSSITRKPVSGERSPEVRGRNLSDKIKDKDDVLPIMQLYNTSDIFNGTAKDSQEAVNAGSTVLLPGFIEVNATRQQNDSEPAGAATFVPDVSESPAKERKGEQSRPGQKHQQGNSDTELTGISKKSRHGTSREETNDSTGPSRWSNHTNSNNSYTSGGAQANRTRHRPTYYHAMPPEFIGYRPEFNGSFFDPGMISVSSRESVNISEVITKRHDGDTIATQETVAVVSYILATLIVFPIAVGVGLILRRLIIRNRKVLEESDTSSEISCRKDALNLENGDFKTSIEKAITKLPRIQHLCHEAEKPPPPPTQESRWEFPRDKLRLQTVLGQGNFGQVWKAEADDLTGHQGTTRLVAVKTVKEGASAREKEDLIRELEIMQQLGNHSNVVTLLGCCTEEEPHYLILEYVMYGKLLAYLRDHRTRQDFYNFSEDSAALTSRDLTVFGYCVARGMEYLASKKIIHRDLAARNVLVDHNKLCKIADFGMSRFANDDGEVIEARHGRNALPIRWMAPESLIYSLFTTKTDVWSFGILMWEIVTLGSTPYPDMAAREVMRNVQNGYRLERPSHCRSELFRVIARCWHADPDRRPEFQILRRDMAQLLEDSMNGHYVDLESFASECTD